MNKMRTWKCERCSKYYPSWKERRAREGHTPGICEVCSIEMATEMVQNFPRKGGILLWYVDYLKRRLNEEREARSADERYMQREMYDLLDSHRRQDGR